MRRLLILVAVLAPVATCFAQVGTQSQQPSGAARARPNSVLIFGGRLSTTDFPNTLLFNLDFRSGNYGHGSQAFDNYIAGGDYERDVVELAHDLHLRAEFGVDDRFGHYQVCCLVVKPHDPRYYADLTVRTSGLIHSGEFWAGPKVRWDNFRIGGIKVAIAATVGLSAVTRTLGRERQREIDRHGNAHVLGFTAPEVGVSLDRVPHLELVVRVMHRSGAGGTFGGMREGYNADVVGVRYAF